MAFENLTNEELFQQAKQTDFGKKFDFASDFNTEIAKQKKEIERSGGFAGEMKDFYRSQAQLPDEIKEINNRLKSEINNLLSGAVQLSKGGKTVTAIPGSKLYNERIADGYTASTKNYATPALAPESSSQAESNFQVAGTQQDRKVQRTDVNGNTITVYESSIPGLIADGTLPAETNQSQTQDRKLGPTEFNNLRNEWTNAGYSNEYIENNLISRSGGDIYLKGNAGTGTGTGTGTGGTGTGAGTGTGGTGADISMYDSLINADAFLTEQFQDPNIKENFSKMSPTLQMAYLQMMKSLGKQVEAGKVINPNVEITPEKIKEFTDQAITELDPYYQEQIRNYKQDLDTSITRLTEDFNTGVRNAEDPFKKNLAAQAEAEAQAGLTYGSERKVRETTNVNEQQQKIDEISKTIGRNVEDSYTTAERKLGSDVISGIETPKLNEYKVTNQWFNQSGTRNLFAPTGGMIGSLQKEKTTAVANRASDLEEQYRKQRLLNINI